ncbi:uncharacterized protein LOC110433832 isoform X2 [Sorghum bicolor]|uniref:uncharacterized protein LOC110433832 isoform X2 n=1 Tax=Sorghum bicolor TaxID=4558 RepID=UPI000B423E96|nr:uncharacterized protein LOC110433832 isoform X2 [Sorghum bicolor]|eukprot:XP_021312282.1 uncharacterized protein LOC110433832 isoform X2 [Sorghum bicolor]
MEGRRTGSLKLVTWDLRSAARGRRKGVRSKGAQEGGSVQLGSRGGRDYGLRTRLNRKQGELLVVGVAEEGAKKHPRGDKIQLKVCSQQPRSHKGGCWFFSEIFSRRCNIISWTLGGDSLLEERVEGCWE